MYKGTELLEFSLQGKIKSCRACALSTMCKEPVPFDGTYQSNIMMVGEAPGFNDNIMGKPFVGKAGKELAQYLYNIGLTREDVLLTNTIKCKPPENRDPLKEEVESCTPLLTAELGLWQGSVLCGLGVVACKRLLGASVDMEMEHGIPRYMDIPCYRNSKGTRTVIFLPMYHPAAGLHSPGAMKDILYDFSTLQGVLNGTITPEQFQVEQHEKDYRVVSAQELYDLLYTDCPFTIALDTETYSGNIPLYVQLSWKDHSGYMFFASENDTLAVLKDYVSTIQPTFIIHNAVFDIKILDALGVPRTNFVDSMVAAYLLQDEPQSLKGLGYRKLGEKMTPYRALVQPQTIANFLNFFNTIAKEEEKTLAKALSDEPIVYTKTGKPKAITQKRIKEIQKSFWPPLQPVMEYVEGKWVEKKRWGIESRLKRIATDIAKDPDINLQKRWNDMDEEVKSIIESRFGKPRVADLTDVDFDKAIEYSCKDADVTWRVWPRLVDKLEERKQFHIFEEEMGIVPMIIDMRQRGFRVDRKKLQDLSIYYETKLAEIQDRVDAIAMMGCKIEIASSQKLGYFLYENLGLPILNTTDTGQPATDEDTLKQLLKYDKCGVVKDIMDWKGLFKNKNTFTDGLLAVTTDDDPTVHTDIKITRTATGRLSTSDPNLMAIPKRLEEGKKIRECFIPSEGCMLTSGDFSQIEMRICAHETQDPELCRIFINDWDIHSRTASQIFGMPESQLDKMKHRYPAKTINFGILYQLTAEGLYDALVTAGCEGWSIDRCRDLINEWFKIFKNVKPFFDRKRSEAKRFGYVTDLFGRRYLIPQIKAAYKPTAEGGGRQACNYPIQGGAQGVMKRGMRKLYPIYEQWRRDTGLPAWPLLQIHDDLVSEVYEDIAYGFIEQYKAIMESCVTLRVPLKVDIALGRSWAEVS